MKKKIISLSLIAIIFFLAIILFNSCSKKEISEEDIQMTIDSCRDGDIIDINRFLKDQGYEAVGDIDAYVYQNKDKIISIQDYGDYVRIGDGKGNSQQFGKNSEYIVHVEYLYTQPAGNAQVTCDINLSQEAVAEIIRLAHQ